MSQPYREIKDSILHQTELLLGRVFAENGKRKVSGLEEGRFDFDTQQKHHSCHWDETSAHFVLKNCWQNMIKTILSAYKTSVVPQEFCALTLLYFDLLSDSFKKMAKNVEPAAALQPLTDREEKLIQLQSLEDWLEANDDFDFLVRREQQTRNEKFSVNPDKHSKIQDLLRNVRDTIQTEKNKPNPDVLTTAKDISHLFLKTSGLPEVQSESTRFLSIVKTSRTAKHMKGVSEALNAALNLSIPPWIQAATKPLDTRKLLTKEDTQAINTCLVAGANATSTAWRVGTDYARHAAVKAHIEHTNANSVTKESGIDQKDVLIIIRDLINLQQHSALDHNLLCAIQKTIDYLLFNFYRLLVVDQKQRQYRVQEARDALAHERPPRPGSFIPNLPAPAIPADMAAALNSSSRMMATFNPTPPVPALVPALEPAEAPPESPSPKPRRGLLSPIHAGKPPAPVPAQIPGIPSANHRALPFGLFQ